MTVRNNSLFPPLTDIAFLYKWQLPIPKWLDECEKTDEEHCHLRQKLPPLLANPCIDNGRELSPGFVVQTVTCENLPAAQQLLKAVFPTDAAHFEVTFSVLQKAYTEHDFMKTVLRSEFWIVVDKSTGDAVGIGGISYALKDFEDAIWGDWVGVHPHYRGKGIGNVLCMFLLEKMVASGKRYARLYTEEADEKANSLYDVAGWMVYKRKYRKDRKCHVIWRQLEIGGGWKNVQIALFTIRLIRFLHWMRLVLCCWFLTGEYYSWPVVLHNALQAVVANLPLVGHAVIMLVRFSPRRKSKE